MEFPLYSNFKLFFYSFLEICTDTAPLQDDQIKLNENWFSFLQTENETAFKNLKAHSKSTCIRKLEIRKESIGKC
jgi:hypothetical protein